MDSEEFFTTISIKDEWPVSTPKRVGLLKTQGIFFIELRDRYRILLGNAGF